PARSGPARSQGWPRPGRHRLPARRARGPPLGRVIAPAAGWEVRTLRYATGSAVPDARNAMNRPASDSFLAPGPLLLAAMIVAAAMSRLLPHPPNFSPLVAI